MGAARFAAVTASRAGYRQYIVDTHRYEQQIKDLNEKLKEKENKHATEIAASCRSFRSQLVAMQQQVSMSRSEVESLKSANADLQRKYQEQDVVIAGLRSVNADLEEKMKGYDNIASFLGKIARGEVQQ
jgi:FtsZ-binding cell division protein ZapB